MPKKNKIKNLQIITTMNELDILAPDIKEYYYIRNSEGVVCAMREKEMWKFKQKCHYYKKKYNRKQMREKIGIMSACYNYIYPNHNINL